MERLYCIIAAQIIHIALPTLFNWARQLWQSWQQYKYTRLCDVHCSLTNDPCRDLLQAYAHARKHISILHQGQAINSMSVMKQHRTFTHMADGHWTKRHVPTTLGIHWVCIGNVLNPAN